MIEVKKIYIREGFVDKRTVKEGLENFTIGEWMVVRKNL